MPAIRPEFHSTLVSQLLDDITYQRSNYFYFLGKIEPWGEGDQPPSPPSSSALDDITVRNNILYLRKVAPNEVSLVTTNYTWTSDTVYDQWDHTIEMQDSAFYVTTDDYNVYKCLNNNYGAPSTVKPTGNSLFPVQTSDGYLWKYMYNVPSFKRTKFMSRGHLPVQRALTDTFYNKGAVEQVVVADPGSGYTDAQLTTINLSGTTTGTGATAHITSVGSLGEILSIDVDDGGSGYTKGALVQITSVAGASAQINIVASGGVITGFDIVNGGLGYTLSDTVDVVVGGASLLPVVSKTTGSILKVIIENAGAGYVSAPSVSILQYPETGHGVYGNDIAVITPIEYNGSIVNVVIEDPGADYPADSATTIVVQGDGSSASFTPVVYNGEIVDVIVENAGSDYSYIRLTVVGAGTGAALTGILAASDFISDQSLIEQVAVSGAVYNAVITNPGDNYSLATTVNIVGDGTGATATCTVTDGSIESITMTSYGQGYTYANLEFVDPNRVTPNNFVDATGYGILPPPNGHGYNAVTELYGRTLSIFTLIKDDAQLNLIAQDYRQYGILQNPLDLITTKRITTSPNYVVFTVVVADVGSMVPDQVLVNNNKRYRVVSIDGNVVELIQMNPYYARPTGVLADETNPTVQYTIQQVTSVPSVNKYSGNLMYVTNNAAFTPTTEQSIAIRTYITL